MAPKLQHMKIMRVWYDDIKEACKSCETAKSHDVCVYFSSHFGDGDPDLGADSHMLFIFLIISSPCLIISVYFQLLRVIFEIFWYISGLFFVISGCFLVISGYSFDKESSGLGLTKADLLA